MFAGVALSSHQSRFFLKTAFIINHKLIYSCMALGIKEMAGDRSSVKSNRKLETSKIREEKWEKTTKISE